MTAVSLGSSSACISKVSINAAGVSIIGKFRCPGVSYDIGRSPFSLSKILLKKIVLSFSPFGNPFLELVGVGALGSPSYPRVALHAVALLAVAPLGYLTRASFQHFIVGQRKLLEVLLKARG